MMSHRNIVFTLMQEFVVGMLNKAVGQVSPFLDPI